MTDADMDGYLDEYDRRAQERRARRQKRRRRRPSRRGERSVAVAWLDRRWLTAVAVGLALLTVVAMALLWPTGAIPRVKTSLAPSRSARVTGLREVSCSRGSDAQCRQAIVSVGNARASVDLGLASTAPKLSVGESVRVSRERVPGIAQGQAGATAWQFVDVDRRGSLLWLAGLSALLAVVVLRWRGLFAALGVVISLLIVTTFLIPAILAGEPALVVALVASLAVMFVTLVLTSGLGPQTLAAALGIGSTLLLTAGIAQLATGAAHLNGRTDELSNYLGTVGHGISLQGIVLAGMVIGALGVLADTAVTQASAVMSLRHANPELGPRQLYRASLRIGRDHLSATIHTLVLAYVGAALPLLLITRYSSTGLIDAVNTQDIAEPIVAALVGCLALICAVPLTTGLAAVLVSHVPASDLAHEHAHQH
jgi:uncharacterized membrane protein